MALDTYADLKAAVQDWINKSSISASADDFITMAEAFLNDTLRNRKMLVLKTGTLSANPLDLSSELTRWRRVKSMSITVNGEDHILNYVSEDLRMAQYADKTTGVPQYYTIIGDSLYVDPAPDSSYAYSIAYYQALAPLSGTINWLYTSNPNIYLYAALSEAAIFAKDDKAAGNYVALRDRYLGILKSMDIRDRQGGTSRMISETRAV